MRDLETSDLINCGNILNHLKYYHLLKEDSALRNLRQFQLVSYFNCLYYNIFDFLIIKHKFKLHRYWLGSIWFRNMATEIIPFSLFSVTLLNKRETPS
jgi:hypothetical protein